ncbi:MAG: hypothetical protein J6A59_08155 [Lachnospiraceae bacterium]|nr:hypothetical protein [Lachnospiraceae bacterium]
MELIKKFKKLGIIITIVIAIIIAIITIVYCHTHIKITVNEKGRMVKQSELVDEKVVTSEIGINNLTISTVNYNEDIKINKENKSIEFINVDHTNYVRYILYDDNTDKQIVDTGIIKPNTKYEWKAYKDLDKGKYNIIWKTEVYNSENIKDSIFNLENTIIFEVAK